MFLNSSFETKHKYPLLSSYALKKKKKRAKTVIRRRRLNKKRVGKSIKSQWGKISKGAGVLAALSNITGADMAASTGQPIASRAQNFSNSILGRVTGFIPFKNAAGANVTQQISLDGMFNKFTGIGLGLLGYSLIPAKILPHKAKAKVLGKSLFGAGLISGIFMPSGNPHNTNLLSPSRVVSVPTSEVSYT